MHLFNSTFRLVYNRPWLSAKVLLLLLLMVTGAQVFAQFKSAVVTVDITPDSPKMLLGYSARQSTGIRDRIHHRIVVMDDGSTRFVIASTEICVVSPSEYDHLASLLQNKLGIAPLHFWWSVTHTHSAPEVGVPGLPESFMGDRYKHAVDTAYTRLIEETLIAGIEQAIDQLQPATLSVGWGFSQANINRRAIGVDNKASLGMNPEKPTDRRIGLLRLNRSSDGKPIALLANYPIHGTVFGPANLQISGDVTGAVSSYVEEKTGAPLLFINGAAGNLAPLYSVSEIVYGKKDSELDQLCVFLGDRILEANNSLANSVGEVTLYPGKLSIETPMKETLQWPADLHEYIKIRAGGKKMVRLPVRFLRINEDIAIWSLPVELFCEISNEIRDRSPFPFTFYFGYTNGWLGYLPTEKEWQHGGYEVETVCPYTPSAGKNVIQAVTGYLEGELKSKNKQNRY